MKIAILAGDGIGPEITAATRVVLEVLDQRHGLGLVLEEHPVGLAAYAGEGSTYPQATRDAVTAADGVVLAPASTYEYPAAADGGINPSAAVRTGLDLYANIRPAWTRPGVPSVASNMDLVIVRENTEGFYADRNMASGGGEFKPTDDVALAVRKITRTGSLRIARAAFDLARRRRNHVTVVHKANVMHLTDGLFLECVNEVAAGYPDVALEEMIVDAMSARLIRTPDAFDVIVTTNMFGDILSDEASELAGGLGLAPALNAGDENAVAQATHGSAPDIAGKGIANPTGLMLSTAMLLDWLGARHEREDLRAAGRAFTAGVDAALADASNHTRDLGGDATTEAFAQAVIEGIG